jgi:Cu(I)/Ag(I) efflux system membrane fusion protein
MKTFLIILITAVVAAGGAWVAATRHAASADHIHPDAAAGRKVAFYQSTMHPWVKSDRPGKCTVCGMELVPVYEGVQGVSDVSTDVVLLPEGTPTVSSIRTVEVKKQPLVRTLRVAGIIDDNDSKHRILSAYIPARIEKLFVESEGAEVEKGQPLATYYSKELMIAASEYRTMGAHGGADRGASESRLRQFGLTAEQIAHIPQRKEDDFYFEILSPVSGTVVKRYVYPGQYVQEGEKLFEVADFSTMWFQFVAYEQDLPFLRVGLPVTITTPSLPGRSIQAAITFINPNLDEATRSARVRVEFSNPSREGKGLHQGHEILHKTYADATVAIEAPETITVPRNAVLWSGNNPRVYVEQAPGTYQQRAVILGRPGDETWEVLEGLAAGERVVASGNMLIDGQAQINSLAGPRAEAPAAQPVLEMTAPEHEALGQYLAAIAELTDTLAADDLAAYNTAIAHMPAPPEGLAAPKLTPAHDLAEARRAFLPLSQQVAEHAQAVRGHFPQLKIFRCPMSDELGEGAPQNAKWIQFTADLRNPYMGKEMLRCGAEVK